MPLRRRNHRAGLPDGWRGILASRSAQWRLLDATERGRLGELADWLLRTKRWEAARGFILTDEARTLIAGHGALLALGLDESWYDAVGTIVVRAGSMTQHHSAGPVRGTVDRTPHTVDGESHHDRGPLMVSWRAARREAAMPRLGRDVVLHEFAHKLDMLDGVVNGTPPIADEQLHERWVKVCTAHYEAVRAGEPGLRDYAGTNPGEFFAVVTEAFFTRSIDLADDKPGLYELFASFYRQDPAARARRVPELPPPMRPRILTRHPTR